LSIFKAKIVIPVKSVRYAKILVDSVSPDNTPTPKGLKVKTWRKGKNVLTYI